MNKCFYCDNEMIQKYDDFDVRINDKKVVINNVPFLKSNDKNCEDSELYLTSEMSDNINKIIKEIREKESKNDIILINYNDFFNHDEGQI